MKTLLPARMAVLNHMNHVKDASVEHVMDALRADYGDEKQFTYDMYLDHLMALEANGLVELENYDVNESEDLILTYKITEDGRGTVKNFVPAQFQK